MLFWYLYPYVAYFEFFSSPYLNRITIPLIKNLYLLELLQGGILVPLLGKTKIWGKGYTTIPNTVRKILELENGCEILWKYDNQEVTIQKIRDNNDK